MCLGPVLGPPAAAPFLGAVPRLLILQRSAFSTPFWSHLIPWKKSLGQEELWPAVPLKFYIWLPTLGHLCSTSEWVMGCRYLPVQFQLVWSWGCVAAASLGCLLNSRESVASAVLSCFRACVTGLEVPPCYPSPWVVQITTQLFPVKDEILSWPPFWLREGEGCKESWNQLWHVNLEKFL